MKTEANIHAGYRDILDAFTLKNLASTAISNLSASSTVISKVFDFGKSFLARKKKKKHHKFADPSVDPGDDVVANQGV